MALFLVLALKGSSSIIGLPIAAKIPATDFYTIEDGKWIVESNVSTSKDLSDFLGIAQIATHFIVPVRGYYGRAQPDLWEWLAAKTSKANAS
jgi:hypothetical protein